VPGPSGRGREFEYIPPVAGSGLAVVTSARGAAFGDLSNDGNIDVVVNPVDGPPVLLRNENPDHRHWVGIKLVGGPKSPRNATCATAFLTANGMRQRQDGLASASYISAIDHRLHFGLGDTADSDSLEIHWSSGAKETIKLPAAVTIYRITEEEGISDTLCGGKPCAANAAGDKPATDSQRQEPCLIVPSSGSTSETEGTLPAAIHASYPLANYV